MTIEVEAKLRVADVARLRARLTALGVALEAPLRQDDVFFTHPSRDMRRLDEALRVRRSGTRYELTYKGPRQEGGTKARREETVQANNDPSTLLGLLGFVPSMRVEKTREAGRLGGVVVALDHVDGLGWFVELEVLVDGDASGQGDGAGGGLAAAHASIDAAVQALGFSAEPRVREAYAELLSRA